MKPSHTAGAFVLALLAACGDRQAAAPEYLASANAVQAEQVHSASGTVTAIAGDRVAISHGPVQGLGWPAMNMGFRASSPRMVQDVNVGDVISFEFREAGGDYELTSLDKAE